MTETESLQYDIDASERKIQQMEDDNDCRRRRIKEIERAESIKAKGG